MAEGDVDQAERSAQRARQVALAVVVLGCAGGIGYALWSDRVPKTAPGDCAPEGGLGCGPAGIEICQSGTLISGVPCTGGCQDDDGVARCRTEAGNLTAPIGAVCQPGMTVCSHDATTLLVCRDGQLTAGATCTRGCVDQGEGKSIFCLDENEGIRFAVGFPCPGFPPEPDGKERACGPDGESVLVCQDGLLVTEDGRRCAPCIESRTGVFSCAPLDAASGP